MKRLVRTEAVLGAARAESTFSAVGAEVGSSSGSHWSYAAGRVTHERDALFVSERTVFDLASLTKVLATTSLALDLAARGVLDVSAPVAALVAEWTGSDRRDVTVADLLEHCSGLPAHRRYYETRRGRASFQTAIAGEPLEYAPRQQAIYSDLGFMMLGFVIETAGGDSLDRLFGDWRRRSGLVEPLGFGASAQATTIARTGRSAWRGEIAPGEVHDDNAYALGGIAAHAGLFGTAAAVGEVARWWLAALDARREDVIGRTAASFVCRSSVPGSSRARGWDTMLTASSCGARLSERAFGHTGFTGTSLWVDPGQDLYLVLLTNYVIGGRDREPLARLRRAFHDAVVDDLRSEPA